MLTPEQVQDLLYSFAPPWGARYALPGISPAPPAPRPSNTTAFLQLCDLEKSGPGQLDFIYANGPGLKGNPRLVAEIAGKLASGGALVVDQLDRASLRAFETGAALSVNYRGSPSEHPVARVRNRPGDWSLTCLRARHRRSTDTDVVLSVLIQQHTIPEEQLHGIERWFEWTGQNELNGRVELLLLEHAPADGPSAFPEIVTRVPLWRPVHASERVEAALACMRGRFLLEDRSLSTVPCDESFAMLSRLPADLVRGLAVPSEPDGRRRGRQKPWLISLWSPGCLPAWTRLNAERVSPDLDWTWLWRELVRSHASVVDLTVRAASEASRLNGPGRRKRLRLSLGPWLKHTVLCLPSLGVIYGLLFLARSSAGRFVWSAFSGSALLVAFAAVTLAPILLQTERRALTRLVYRRPVTLPGFLRAALPRYLAALGLAATFHSGFSHLAGAACALVFLGAVELNRRLLRSRP